MEGICLKIYAIGILLIDINRLKPTLVKVIQLSFDSDYVGINNAKNSEFIIQDFHLI